MDREEVLLKEYEVCQLDNNSSGTRFWIAFGIFFGINTALLGWIAPSIISKSMSLSKNNLEWLSYITDNVGWLVFILVLGLGIIGILISLWLWLNRVNYLIRMNHHRMREIEEVLGMLKNSTIHWLDNRKEVPNEQRERLDEIRRRYPPPRTGSTIVPSLFIIVILLWIAAIVMSWLPI